MANTSSNILEYTFGDTLWHNLKLFGQDTGVTVRNTGGVAISIYRIPIASGVRDDMVTDEYLNGLGIDPVEIGGLTYEISSTSDMVIYAKASKIGAIASVRIYGTVDPKEDLSVVVTNLNNLVLDVNNHKSAINNPHGVNKTQVGLGNIPNAISNDIATNDSLVLATTRLTSNIYNQLVTHRNAKTNPHEVTKDQVGLGSVANFAIASNGEAIDETINDRYMTPMTTYTAVKSWVPQALSVPPQSIVTASMLGRETNWTSEDVDNATNIVSIVDNLSVIVNAGLSVAFADKGKIRVSEKTTKIYTLRIPTNPTDGIYYVYCNITDKGIIDSCAMTNVAPYEGSIRDTHTGDFFNACECVMYGSDDLPVRRVYLAKIYLANFEIVKVISQPLGCKYRMQVSAGLKLGERLVLPNPYIGFVNTTAMVEYPTHVWGDTKWNDQMGVISSSLPGDEMNNIVTQVGLMGFLASGVESGSALGANFVSITSPLRVKCVIEKVYR